MKDVEDLLKQVLKKAKDKDGKYLYGVEFSSDSKPGYKALVRFSKADVPAAVFMGQTKAELKKNINRYLNSQDIKDVNIMFYEGQIELERQAIRFHENLIKDYEDTHS